jgi:hypothetical protein
MLGTALLEAVSGLAFEIDDDEIIALHQHLAEVVVAVDACLQALGSQGRQGIDARQYLIVLRQHGAGPIAIRRRHLLQTRFQHSKRVACFVNGTLPVGVDIGARQRLRRERRISRWLCQCSMQFGGTHGQYPNQRQIGFMRIDGHGIAGGRRSILFKMTLQILERVSPPIALIGNIALQHRH